MSFTALNRRMLDYQISCGPVAVQIVAPWTGVGYSTDVNEIIDWANELDGDAVGASAVYTNVNPCVAHHTDFRRAGAVWTKNAHIIRRRAIFADADVCDPARPSGYCASDAEVAAAVKVMDGVQANLSDHGVSKKSVARALSGNGSNLILFTDWACDAQSDAAVLGLVKGLARAHNTPDVEIDISVGDRRRIRKLYGCQTRKKMAPGRSRRRSGVVEMPELSDIETIPLETIERFVTELGSGLPEIKTTGDGVARPGAQAKFVRLFAKYCDVVGAEVTAVRTLPSGKVLVSTSPCLLHDDHDGAVGVTADGVKCCQCFHARCSIGWSKWSRAVEEKFKRPMRLDGGIAWRKE